MAENNKLKIKSSWQYDENHISILQTNIIENDRYEQEAEAESTEDISEFSPLVFHRPENGEENFVISFHCNSCNNINIKRFSVLSDTRTVEVNHNTDGYLFCVRGNIVLKNEDEKLFKCSSKLDLSSSEVYFKFPVKQDVTEIKIFQVTLDILVSDDNVAEDILGTRTIDLEKVRSYLGEIPESGKGLFKNMEAYQKNQQSMKSSMLAGSSLGNFGMMGLMSALMGGMNTSSKISPKNNISEAKTHVVTQKGPKETVAMVDQLPLQQSNEHCSNGDQSHEQRSNNDQSNENRSNDDHSSDSGVERESISPDILPQSDVLKQLMGSAQTGGQDDDSGMLSMLKNICGSVSNRRAMANKDKRIGNQETTHLVHTEAVENRTDIQEIVEEQLQNTEDRLKNYIDQKLTDIEDRLNQKLDRILMCLSKTDDNKPP